MSKSKLTGKYNKAIDSQSAYEMLTEKLEEAAENSAEVVKPTKTVKAEKTMLEKIGNSSVTKSLLRTAGNTIVRSLLGSLGLGGTTRRRKTTNWF